MLKLSLFLLIVIAAVNADVVHLIHDSEEDITTTPPPPPRPYSFAYKAGRFPGHSDRIHAEVSDGSGTVRGSYSYVDPRNQVRTVEYIADEHGFHPSLSHPAPAETVAVAKERERHYALYAKIAEDHANNPYPQTSPYIGGPRETEAVERAREKHLSLYEQIAAHHARIAAEREALKQESGENNSNTLSEEENNY